jgi:hypothetical protein
MRGSRAQNKFFHPDHPHDIKDREKDADGEKNDIPVSLGPPCRPCRDTSISPAELI